MNPRLRSILIGIGLLTLVIVGIVLIPRGLSIYYQSRGGQHIDYVMRSVEGIQEMVCEPLPESNQAALEEVEDGIEDLHRAVRFNRRNSQAYYHLGKAYCLLGEPDDAMKSYQQYTELRPDNPLGHIGLGFAYEDLGETEKSKDAWIEANLQPHEFNAVGDEMYKLDEYGQAIQWYERAILVDPESAEAWLNLGNVYATKKEIEKSIEAFENAWKISSNSYALDYANMLTEYSEPESAILVLNDALQIFLDSKNRLDWWKKLIDIYYSRYEWEDAEPILVQALEEYPDDPDLHISLGWVYYNQGIGFEVANDQFEQAIVLLDKGGRGFAALAELFKEEQRFQDADLMYQKAIERAPNHRWYYLERGDTARDSGNYSFAIELYRDAIDRFPNFARAYYQLAWALHLQGNDEDAITAIATSLELLESPVESYYLRAGDLFRFSGFKTKALEAYYQVLSINPNNQAALDGIELLGDG